MSRRRWTALLAGTAASLLAAVATAWIHPAFAEPSSTPSLARSTDATSGPAARAADARLLPDDLAPDLSVLPPSDLYVVDDRAAGGSLRLKFTTVVWNAGRGPMEIRGSPVEGDAPSVRQILHRASGGTREAGPVGSFDFDHRHGHVHLSSFARYELWSLEGDRPVERVATNQKVGFCLMDNLVVDERNASDARRYDDGCDAGVQGISPGWGDRYVAQLYEQDLVIDDVPDGRYRLVNVANPDGVLAEARLDNNVAAVDVMLVAGSVRVVAGSGPGAAGSVPSAASE